MASKRAARRAVIEKHGRMCFMCGRGPLQRRALHLAKEPITGHETVPVCTPCRDMIDEGIDDRTARAQVQELCEQYDRMVTMCHKLGVAKLPMPDLLRDTFRELRAEIADLREENAELRDE